MTKPNHLRSLLRTGRLLAGVGARDALDARLIEDAQFDFVWASSFCISAAHCVPDSSILSMTQFLDAARSMNEAVRLPVVFDADTGYGNEHNVAYATKRIEEAGLAALCIEDKVFPKQSSLLPGARHDLLTIDEFTKKIESAVSARRSEDFIVIARTEALIAGLGQEEALRRAHAYEEAGADCILLHSKSKSASEVVGCLRAWTGKARIVLVPTNYPDLIEPAIEELGKVGMVIYGNHSVRAAVKAVRDVLSEMRAAHGIHTVGDRLATLEEVFSLQRDSGKPGTAREA
jgi:phosphoenolpyruvate phosphomutase